MWYVEETSELFYIFLNVLSKTNEVDQLLFLIFTHGKSSLNKSAMYKNSNSTSLHIDKKHLFFYSFLFVFGQYLNVQVILPFFF